MPPSFLPYVGRDFESRLPRVLVLGESHWGEPSHALPTITQAFIHESVFEKRYAFTTKVAKLVSLAPPADPLSRSDLIETWNGLAFYNYVQRLVADRPRIAPSDSDWSESRDAFAGVLESLRPHIAFALGFRLWTGLIGALSSAPQESPIPHLLIAHRFGSTLIVPVAHPSSRGFRYQPWQDRVKSGLTLAASIQP